MTNPTTFSISNDPDLDEIVRRLVAGFRPERIYLFGSHARGDAGPESDLDLMMVFPDGTDRRATVRAIYRSLTDCVVPVDVVVATPELLARHGADPGFVYAAILREGRTVYAA